MPLADLVELSPKPFHPPAPAPPALSPLMSPPLSAPLPRDPFAEWLVSLVGWHIPLRESQQAVIVSLLGVSVMLLAVLFLLLFIVGVNDACGDCSDCADLREEQREE